MITCETCETYLICYGEALERIEAESSYLYNADIDCDHKIEAQI